jgi:hypothetical protein
MLLSPRCGYGSSQKIGDHPGDHLGYLSLWIVAHARHHPHRAM